MTKLGMIRVGLLALALVACAKKKDEPAGAGTAPATGTTAATGATPTTGGAIELPAIDIAAGVTSTCALMKDGTVRCWGRTDLGETGAPARSAGQVATPVAVAGISGATALVGGGDPGDSGDAFCTLGGGKVTCWGHPQAIPLRVTGEGPRDIPALAGATQLALGTGYGLALAADGTVSSWGKNTFKQRGVDGLTAYADETTLAPIPGLTGVTAVATGQTHACALLGDGTATCWGYAMKKLAPTPVAGATDLTAIAAGQSDQTCGIKKDGSVVCWTSNLTAAPLAALTGVAELAMRVHRCARTTAGAISCWGSNWRGQLGQPADHADHATPVAIAGVASAVAVATSPTTTCAVTGDGAAWCWGYNRFGQLGDGTLVDRAEPARVAALNARTLPAADDGTAHITPPPAQTWDDVPAACKHGPLAVAWARVAGDSFPVESAVARIQADGKTIAITLSNHGVDPANPGEERRGPQVGVSVRFAKLDLADGKKPLPVDLGTYSQDLTQDHLIYVSAADRTTDNLMLSSLGLTGADAGTVTLSKLDGGWVCGELALHSKEAQISGPFAAKVSN